MTGLGVASMADLAKRVDASEISATLGTKTGVGNASTRSLPSRVGAERVNAAALQPNMNEAKTPTTEMPTKMADCVVQKTSTPQPTHNTNAASTTNGGNRIVVLI